MAGTRSRVAAAAAATGLAAACAGVALTAGPVAAATESATATAQRAIASRPTTKEAWTARVLLPVHTRSAPRAKARKTSKLSVSAPYNGGANVLLVLGARVNKEGVWYRVRLTSRPNDAAGWIPAEAVQVKRTPWRVVVHLGTRTMELMKAGKRVGRWKVAVGTPANPTPVGRFAVSEVVKQRNPAGFFGTYIITLTAHSENLSEFDGGDGRVALHGTNRPALLGQAVSHGCVRLDNAVATRLGRNVPPGAPVDIVN
jgi:lipoprotein-anchoring transpeptidase ErfK/SrfK